MNIESIVELKVKLVGNGSLRHLNYDEWEDAYWGRYTLRRSQDSWGLDRLKKYFKETESGDEKVYLTVNVIRPMAEGKRAALATLPRVRGIPPTVDTAGYDAADEVEKLVEAIWQYSDIDVAYGDQAWYMVVQGSAVLVVVWDEDQNRSRIVVRSPRNFYAKAKDLDRRILAAGIFVQEYPGMVADEMYPGHGFDKEETVEITDYWSETENVVFADDGEKIIKRVKHDLGYVPIMVVPDISVPGTIFGDPDVMGMISLQTELNMRFAYETRMIRKTINAPMVIEDPINAPREIPEDEGAVITVGKGGGVSYAPPPKLDYDWWKAKDELRSYMNQVSDTPSAMSSEWEGGTLTGKGLNALMSPFASRIKLRNTYVHRCWWHATRWAIDMQIHLGDTDKPLVMRGRTLGVERVDRDSGKYTDRGDWLFTFDPSKFQDWYEFEIYNEELDYVDAQTRFVIIVQALSNQIISLETARANSFLVRDKSEEREQVKAEMMEKIEMQMQAEQMAASVMTASPDMNDPQRQQYMMQAGRMGEAPPADLTGGLMDAAPLGAQPMAAGGIPPEERPAPPLDLYGGGGDLQMVADFFRTIDKIKGRVWIAGDIVDGMLDEDMKILVYVDNPLDKATISNEVGKMVEELHGKMKFYTVTPPKTEPVLEVTPGTQGYEVQGQVEGAEEALLGADLEGELDEELLSTPGA